VDGQKEKTITGDGASPLAPSVTRCHEKPPLDSIIASIQLHSPLCQVWSLAQGCPSGSEYGFHPVSPPSTLKIRVKYVSPLDPVVAGADP